MTSPPSINDVITAYFGADVFARDATADRLAKVKATFAFVLNGRELNDILPALARFCDEPPFTYWNRPLVDAVQLYIVGRHARLLKAFEKAGTALDTCLVHLLDRSWSNQEQSHDISKATDIQRLISVSMPAHLRVVEHIYGNLLRFLWVLENDKSFTVPKNALGRLEKFLGSELGSGFDDDVRNGLAHGEVYFENGELKFGKSPHHTSLSPSEFEHQIDALWATSISIIVGLLIALAKYAYDDQKILRALPARCMSFILSGIRDYEYLSLHGSVETKTPRGNELVLFATFPRSGLRFASFECLKVGLAVYLLSGSRYDAIQFSIEAGVGSLQLAILDLTKIGRSYDQGLPASSLVDVFHFALFWNSFGEKIERWQMRLRFFRHFYKKAFEALRGRPRIYIRKLENVSVGWRARVKVTAVVSKEFGNLDESEISRQMQNLTRKLKRQRVWAPPTAFERKISLPILPSYVWIFLYREDRSLREVSEGGWLGSNLIAVSEFKRFPWLRRIERHAPNIKIGRTSMVIGKPAMFRKTLTK
jgi:hypothetical protein